MTPQQAVALWTAVALGNPANAFWRVALQPVIANVAASPPDPDRFSQTLAEIKANYRRAAAGGLSCGRPAAGEWSCGQPAAGGWSCVPAAAGGRSCGQPAAGINIGSLGHQRGTARQAAVGQ